MTREQAEKEIRDTFTEVWADGIIKALEQEPTTKNNLGVDCISRDSAIKALDYDIKCFEFKRGVNRHMDDIAKLLNTIYETQANNIKGLPPVTPQEPKTGQYEKHTDHTDCIWYGSDSGCPVTCSQYRDGWNDAMDYIFKNGKGYQPYRHDG